MGNALAKIELPSAPLANIGELRSAIDMISRQANMVMPVVKQDFIPPMHSVSLRMVVIEPNSHDAYKDGQFCSKDERALTKTGLLKIWQAAGGSVSDSYRTDDGSDPYHVTWTVVGTVPQLDGRVVQLQASKDVDLRDGSPQCQGWTAARLKMARQHIVPLAESKAMLRMIRSALALAQKYTLEDLAKPFVVPALVPDLDMSDPEIKRIAVEATLRASGALYAVGGQQGPAPALPPPEVVEPIDTEPIIDITDQGSALPSDPFGDVEEDPAPLPIPDNVLKQVPTENAKRFEDLHKVNLMADKAIDKFGAAKAEPIFRKHASGFDWIGATDSEIMAAYNAIVADLKGGA